MIVRMWLQERDQLRADWARMTKHDRDTCALAVVASRLRIQASAIERAMERRKAGAA